jgi:shikimate dehydrogenase
MAKATPRRVGLIGRPVNHSRSPALQQAAFDALDIAARYELWDTPASDLRKRVESLRQPDMLGANVTIPHKVAIMPYLDTLATSARRLTGAVNTIVREESPRGVTLTGHNTDVTALLRVLDEEDVWVPNMRALVLGAGGAARAALGAALLRGARPWIAARKRSSARAALEALYARRDDLIVSPAPPTVSGVRAFTPPAPEHLKSQTLALDDLDALAEALSETHLLINATPAGTRDPLASPIPIESLRRMPRNAFVMDMVYNPPETALVRAAHAAGLRAAGGFSMLLYQGAESFTLWTGAEAPLAVMRAALEAALQAEG